MPLRKPWKPLERSTVRSIPDRYGVYELGDGSGTVLAVDHGPLRDELKEALAYGDGEQVRWRTTQNRLEAERLVEAHRERLAER